MAQEKLGGTPDYNLREAEEIERLLKEEEKRAEEKTFQISSLRRLLSQKRYLVLVLAVLLIWGVGWGILSLTERNPEVSRVSTVEEAPDHDTIPAIVQIQKPNIYQLEPFFIPVRSKNKKTERFLHVTAHLVLSNRRLHADIDKVQPLIRQSVYAAIQRKKLKDFEKSAAQVEEKIKREILTASNSFLLSGTGTITNVVFTQFLVSPS